MTRFLLLPAAALSAVAQTPAPIGIVRGDLVKWEASGSRGELDVRGADGHVLTCGFDPKTYFERENQRIAPAGMAVGDRLEIVADRKPGAAACYARTVHVLDPSVLQRRPSSARPREFQNATESIVPRGNMTFAGIVLRTGPEAVLLKTRTGGEERLLLRADTRYINEGSRVEPALLKTGTRVFIRAGRNLDGDVEAYQIIWGDIVRP